MNLWVVGSGTLVPDSRRGAPAYWIEVGIRAILMDCGSGTLRTLARLRRPWERTTHVLISHLHTDHVGELAPLLFALKHGVEPPRTEPLHLLGPRGLGDHLEHLAAAHGTYVRDPGFGVEVTELEPGEGWESADGGLRVGSAPTRHTSESLAFRLEAGGANLGYTGDTGPAPELASFLHGCEVLIAECSHPDEQGMSLHLTPATLAPLARAADPEVLLTVHAYPSLDPEEVPALLARRGYDGRVRAGWDGLRVELGGERVIVKDAL